MVDAFGNDENMRNYIPCALESTNGSAEDNCQPLLIFSQIGKVLAVEAPISKSLLGKRVLSAYALQGWEPDLKEGWMKFSPPDGLKRPSPIKRFFIETRNSNRKVMSFSVFPNGDGMRWDMEDIQAEEIANAVRYILTNHISLSNENLLKEFFKLFGFARGSATMEEIRWV